MTRRYLWKALLWRKVRLCLWFIISCEIVVEKILLLRICCKQEQFSSFFSFEKKIVTIYALAAPSMTIEIASQPCLILAASSSQRCLCFWHHTVCLSFLPAFFHFFALAASTKSSKSFPSNSSLPTQKRQRRRLRRSDVLHSHHIMHDFAKHSSSSSTETSTCFHNSLETLPYKHIQNLQR